MQILEKLYGLAEQHLRSDPPSWQDFSVGFKSVFNADMTLYHVRPANDAQRPTNEEASDWNQRVSVVASSNAKATNDYLSQNLGDTHAIPEEVLAPHEPMRRTDFFSDEEWDRLGEFADYLSGLGIYYNLVAPATLADTSLLRLFLWRDRDQGDFTQLEKQRIALFMRYLLAVVEPKALMASGVSAATTAFGNKYGLTNAEIGILDALLEGQSPKDIASDTDRTYRTVRWHIQNILEKCQVSSQKQLLHEFYGLIRR